MTRMQARKLADKIVAAVEKTKPHLDWSRIDLPIKVLGKGAAEALDRDYALITGCLPYGWRLAGEQGSDTLIILRRDEQGQTPAQALQQAHLQANPLGRRA